MKNVQLPLAYSNGILQFDEINVKEISEKFGTPLYVYSADAVRSAINSYKKGAGNAKFLLCFAMKSNSNSRILSLVQKEGLGADIVSGGELYRALKAGITPDKIVFSGVGKTDHEIKEALEAGIFLFSVESEDELNNLSSIASQLKKTAKISIRVNPDVDASTHPYISTGLRENKFGVMHDQAIELYKKTRQMNSIEPVGIGFHIGSQLSSLDAFAEAGSVIRKLALELRNLNFPIQFIDAGGGLGISYDGSVIPSIEDYVQKLISSISLPDITIIFEPGRSLIGNAGILITKILYTKENSEKKFFICDAGMNDLMRPSLYQAHHEILAVDSSLGHEETADLVGPVCESGDFLAKNRKLPAFRRGDLAVVASAGAYAFSMSSTYNSRPRPAEVLIENGTAQLIRKRETYEDLIQGEMII
ncbi:MAG: diaminopimelate decarboxylase [Spirochaetia bacterium]|nr:diaminopimelate decarboxylase [Spirochaetia bacterium]